MARRESMYGNGQTAGYESKELVYVEDIKDFYRENETNNMTQLEYYTEKLEECMDTHDKIVKVLREKQNEMLNPNIPLENYIGLQKEYKKVLEDLAKNELELEDNLAMYLGQYLLETYDIHDMKKLHVLIDKIEEWVDDYDLEDEEDDF